MKIIVFHYNIPRPDQSSGERRFVALLKLMAKHHEVDLCVTRFYPVYLKDKYQTYVPDLNKNGINVLPIEKGNIPSLLRKKRYDVGFFEFFWEAEQHIYLFWKYQPQAVTIVDSVDVHFAREETQARLGQIPWKQVEQTRTREVGIYKKADLTLAVSHEDVSLLKENHGVERVFFVPNIVPSIRRKSGPRKPVAVFIGSFLWHPNIDAMTWFTSEVWPMVHQQEPEAELQIIGSSPTPEILALDKIDGVNVLGFVPETTPYLENAAVSIAPLRYGGGMKGKVNEALAHGLPIVSTTIGAQGFNPKVGEEMVVTDDPREFADSIIELFRDPEKQEKMGLAGQKLNESHCSPEKVGLLIQEVMGEADALKNSGNIKRNAREVRAWQRRTKMNALHMHLRNLLGLNKEK